MTRIRLAGIGLVVMLAFAFQSFAQCPNGGSNGGCGGDGCANMAKNIGQKIETAKTIIANSGNADAQKLLAQAIEHYTKGVELNNAKNYSAATIEFQNAMKLVAKALSLANGGGCTGCLDNFVKNLADRIAAAKTAVAKSGSAEAQKILDEAIVYYEKGVALKAANKTQEAWTALRTAATLVSKAMQIASGGNCIGGGCPGGGGCNGGTGGCGGTLDQKITMVDAKIAEASKVVAASGKPDAVKALDEAKLHYANAVELNKQGKTQAAMTELTLASQLACKAIELAKM